VEWAGQGMVGSSVGIGLGERGNMRTDFVVKI
jgi:hypothetical protein